MKINANYITFTFCISVLCSVLITTTAYAQTQKVQVVTKTVQESFDYEPGLRLEIQGEKADLSISSWDNEEISISIKLISKALTKEIAVEELDNVRYIAEKKGKTLHLKNYFILPAGQKKFEAILSAALEVKVPRSMDLKITSKYGDVQLNSLSGNHEVDMKYGKLQLNQINTNGHFKSYFGDLIAQGVNGKYNFELNHVKTEINNFSGEIELKTNLGDVHLSKPGKVKSLRVYAVKSDITTESVNTDSYQFDLQAEYGDIFLPEDSGVKKQRLNWKKGSTTLPLFLLKTKFGKIKIE